MVHIREFEQTSEDYNAVANVMNIVWREPIITADDLRGVDEEHPSHLVHHRFVAEADDEIVGFGSFSHNERFYHRQRFWVHLDVLPDWRQRGAGTQLYDHMLVIMQTEYGANELHAETTDSRDYSIRFLEKRGFWENKREPQSRLGLAKFDGTPFQGLETKMAAMGIEIRALSDLMRDDPQALYQVYELHQMLVFDVPDPAPRTKVDFDSWQNGYSVTNPYYLPEAHFMALHDNAYIGLTSLWGSKTDEKLYTGMSGVKREYRRKGLATALKLRAIAFAQAQGTRALLTSNNDTNPMLQLNLKLGFEIYDARLKFVRRF
ncbi:MAG: GNAT family N-acetyltransferase [Chloroflexota bacterium]